MAKTDYVQFNFRLNLNNPHHLKIYRTLTDLNTDIHKSRTNFIVEALSEYIGGISDDNLTKDGARNKTTYARREDLEQMEERVTAKVMKEVAEFMSRAALESQGFGNPIIQMMQQVIQAGKQPQAAIQPAGDAPLDLEEPDAALEEMAVLFSQDNYGEE